MKQRCKDRFSIHANGQRTAPQKQATKKKKPPSTTESSENKNEVPKNRLMVQKSKAANPTSAQSSHL